jgi:hypothetical protein
MHLNRLLYPDQANERITYGLVERTARSLVQAPVLPPASEHPPFTTQ